MRCTIGIVQQPNFGGTGRLLFLCGRKFFTALKVTVGNNVGLNFLYWKKVFADLSEKNSKIENERKCLQFVLSVGRVLYLNTEYILLEEFDLIF